MAKKEPTNTEKAIAKLEPIAKLVSKTAEQLWKMFVLRYVAKGVAQLFLAVFINICYLFLFWSVNRYFMMIPLTIAGILVYDAIQLLINPYYFAMNDVLYRIKSEHSLWSK